MNKKLLWTILAMLMCTTPMWGQVNNNDDGTDDEDEIVVEFREDPPRGRHVIRRPDRTGAVHTALQAL